MERNVKYGLLVALDMVLLSVSFILACKFTRQPLVLASLNMTGSISLIVFLQLLVLWKFGLYKSVLRYASIDFLITVLKAVTVSNFVSIFAFYITKIDLSLSAIFIYWLLTIFFVGGCRFLVRYYFELRLRLNKGKRVLIYGAGDMGSLALRQLLLNKAVIYSPIGFIDDDKKKIGRVIRGVKVLGSLENLESIIQKYRVEEVVVSIAEIESGNLNAVVKRCRQENIVCRIIPCFSRLVEIEPDIRNVELADLMRRTPRDLDNDAIKGYIQGKKILITGAAGSIGSEIVRQCLQYGPKVVIALDQSEYGLYSLEEELGKKVDYILCDATNKDSLESVFKNNNPEIVFHAAAYKHVPLLEANPIEGIKNNIVSTRNLCELSDKYQVISFVMISTDKAVKPSSIMGASKRVCELLVQNFDTRSKTEFVAVRFGNVLGSSGSVVPKFIDQIKKGGPITVTHPDTTRYFMLIDEAVQLVLQAAAIGNGGEIFILDMGKPIKIADMAEDLIYLMGREPHKDIKIEFSGMRLGEKIHEELFYDEIEEPTIFKEITIGKSKIVEWEWLKQNVDNLLDKANSGSINDVMRVMAELVPEGIVCNKKIKGNNYATTY